MWESYLLLQLMFYDRVLFITYLPIYTYILIPLVPFNNLGYARKLILSQKRKPAIFATGTWLLQLMTIMIEINISNYNLRRMLLQPTTGVTIHCSSPVLWPLLLLREQRQHRPRKDLIKKNCCSHFCLS